MDPLLASLVKLQQQLSEHSIESALIGGLTLGVWGRARATKDVDLKVLLTRDDAPRLLAALGDDYKLTQRAPLESLRRNGVIFVQDATGTRVDLLLAEAGFDQTVVERARRVEIQPNVWVRVATAEDIIVYKLISTRLIDLADAELIVNVQGKALDDQYVKRTLREFEIALADSTLVEKYEQLRQKSTKH